MKGSRELYNRLRNLAGASTLLPAIVKELHSDNTLTCAVGDYEVYDVQMQARISGDGLIAKPAVGSVVLLDKISENNYAVVLTSELQSIVAKVDDTTVEIDNAGVVIKKATDSLKDVMKLTIEATQQIVVASGTNPNYAKLTQALVKLNNIMPS